MIVHNFVHYTIRIRDFLNEKCLFTILIVKSFNQIRFIKILIFYLHIYTLCDIQTYLHFFNQNRFSINFSFFRFINLQFWHLLHSKKKFVIILYSSIWTINFSVRKHRNYFHSFDNLIYCNFNFATFDVARNKFYSQIEFFTLKNHFCIELMIEFWNYRSYFLCRQSIFNFFKDFILEIFLFVIFFWIEMISKFWMFKFLWFMNFKSYFFQKSRFRRFNMFRFLKIFNFKVHDFQKSNFS